MSAKHGIQTNNRLIGVWTKTCLQKETERKEVGNQYNFHVSLKYLHVSCLSERKEIRVAASNFKEESPFK